MALSSTKIIAEAGSLAPPRFGGRTTHFSGQRTTTGCPVFGASLLAPPFSSPPATTSEGQRSAGRICVRPLFGPCPRPGGVRTSSPTLVFVTVLVGNGEAFQTHHADALTTPKTKRRGRCLTTLGDAPCSAPDSLLLVQGPRPFAVSPDYHIDRRLIEYMPDVQLFISASLYPGTILSKPFNSNICIYTISYSPVINIPWIL